MKGLAVLAFVPEPDVIQEFSQIKEDASEVLDSKQKKFRIWAHASLKILPLWTYLCSLQTISLAEKCQGTVGVILDFAYRCGTVFQKLTQIYLLLTLLSRDSITLFM